MTVLVVFIARQRELILLYAENDCFGYSDRDRRNAYKR